MIRVTPLGVNGAFTKYYHNNYVFELGDRKLLVDTGTTLRYSLQEAGFKESDITDIVITHLHSDHVGGLEEFAQRCKWIHNHKPTLWIRNELAGGLTQIISNGLCTDGLSLEDYFNIEFIKGNFMLGLYEIETLETTDLHAQNMFSMGLKINDIQEGINIVFTSDIAKHEAAQFDGYFDSSTVALFHDVSTIKNPVHSYIEDVVIYYKDKIHASKIYGMHYQDDLNITEFSDIYGIEFVEAGQTLTFINK
ncbi:MBL fold metallo-hydrolase [Alkalihalophilus pseudofirmus]|uniref:MBL fold metallo-hydrolase n=1 Tax=Alkalihalophilus pseudofirmus TaxID=79885 RepID=UPI00259B7202|nr:MBL fold metallo-hydrolase [Alkalihalophilus pseudofirmus]WEG18685.1 MBL fold metallo-hydrolase [Alkalihalophilus pseudofirmus]